MLRTTALRMGLVASLAASLLLPASAVAQGTKITFLTPPWGQPPDADALAKFTADTGIEVEIQSVQMSDLFSRVQVAAGAGQPAADVIFLTEEAPSNIVATGNVEPLDDLIASSGQDMSDFTKTDFWQVNGQTFGMPVYNQLVMMDYNTARAKQAGFDAAPTTWTELFDQAKAVKEKGVDQNPIAMGAIDWSWYLMALSMGDPMFDADLNPVFADQGSKAREAMAMLLDAFKTELISPDIAAGSITQHNSFWSGVGTFHQGWQGSVVVGNGKDSKQAPDVAYLLLPDEHWTWSFPAAIGIGKGSPNKDAAFKFIQWYTQPEQQTAIFDAYGLYPSRTSVAEALNTAGKISGYDVITDQAQYVHELPRQVLWWGPFTSAVTQQIIQAVQGGQTADEVVDAIKQQWDSLKAEYE
jgi:multiple sugar transport system substrate-binding protein